MTCARVPGRARIHARDTRLPRFFPVGPEMAWHVSTVKVPLSAPPQSCSTTSASEPSPDSDTWDGCLVRSSNLHRCQIESISLRVRNVAVWAAPRREAKPLSCSPSLHAQHQANRQPTRAVCSQGPHQILSRPQTRPAGPTDALQSEIVPSALQDLSLHFRSSSRSNQASPTHLSPHFLIA